ncbi:ATP-dependent DNA helicase RecG [bioreactor metagenome]|uniref:ATP-dependent DNA helicase RecG n=1 Tax=bioreactor metagenome TaxID=1076179 RepID=A0A644T6J2_9ZZZZ|nr:ATP-dependent DNA helicase RecG [Candidatus Elulimicrobiales bacterium]
MNQITLATEISKINRLSKEHAIGLKRLKIETVKDLLTYFPSRYADERETRNIENLEKGENVTLFGEIKNLNIKRSFRGHVPMSEGKLVDATGSVKLVWFHQAYIAKMYEEGEFVKVSGVVQEKNGVYSLLNPSIEKASRDHIFYENNIFEEIENKEIRTKELIPVYKETKGVSSNYLNILIKKVLSNKVLLKEIEENDPLPKNILNSLHLPPLEKALLYIHLPKAKDIKKAKEQILVAQKRFSFEEIFYLQLLKQSERIKAKESLSFALESNQKETETLNKSFIDKIEKQFKFKLTKAQLEAIKNISKDLRKTEPMGRLLEGDVGSGKTLVAAAVAHLTTHYDNRDRENGKKLQVAVMAPTEILATQHFESFINFFKKEPVEIGLLTGKICKKFPSKVNPGGSTNISKPQLKRMVEEGNISIVIGTHALIQKTLNFQNLALAIIDEQHRFGVKQRAALANKKSSNTKVLAANDLKNLTNKRQKITIQKEKLPHLLSMTATPIPRTLALTIFGDLDLTVLDELPKNRKPIITKIEKEKDREKVYLEILEEIKNGYQVYVVVPRIDELDEEEMQTAKKLNLRSVASEVKNLEEFFNQKNEAKIKIFGMHSKVKKEDKESIMQDFADNKIQVLVSTSVIEVGVNVPNATRMIIEGAERFGLAQLHQLRGRIGRGERESVCYLFSNTTSDITFNRLSSLLKSKNGFELAEMDLEQRGIGSLVSGKQWGVSDLAMEAIKNLKLVEIAREEAKNVLEKDLSLEKHPLLKAIVLDKEKAHME